MQIKITPFTTKTSHAEGEFLVGGNYYLAMYHSAGMVTQIRDDDEWLGEEMAWITRSEIPFVTAMRHVQLKGDHLVEGSLTPILRRSGPHHEVHNLDAFPSEEECKQLVYRGCKDMEDHPYNFYKKEIDTNELRDLVAGFPYDNDLLVRAGSCLYKAHILLDTSSTFSEEVYVNTFIAFEAIVENMMANAGTSGTQGRTSAVDKVGDYLAKESPGIDFREHEEEMRDSIRNNILHPFRRAGYTNAQPFLMADFVFEDLGLIDWIFKKVLEGAFK